MITPKRSIIMRFCPQIFLIIGFEVIKLLEWNFDSLFSLVI